MEQNQIPFMVIGYAFLKPKQIDSILQEMMSTDWYSQWLPKHTLTIRMDMRANLRRNWLGMNDTQESDEFAPMKRIINFSLSTDKHIAPETVEKIIAAFREAFHARMVSMPHGTNADDSTPLVTYFPNKVGKKRQPNRIEWESYPIKAVMRGKNN